MNCLEVRDRLAERAVSTLDPREDATIERHLRWCAGCRKEAAELEQGAALLAFTLHPAFPPPALEERVVETVREAAGKASGGRRRTRSAVVSAVAGMVAVAALSWGAVMTGRADRFRDSAQQAVELTRRQADALQRFQKVLTGLGLEATAGQTRLGQLTPVRGHAGGGVALVLVSPRIIDFVMVVVNHLPSDPALLPYRVTIQTSAGVALTVGRIAAKDLDAGGGAEVFHQFDRDLTGFTEVVVQDAAGAAVLRGRVDANSHLSGP